MITKTGTDIQAKIKPLFCIEGSMLKRWWCSPLVFTQNQCAKHCTSFISFNPFSVHHKEDSYIPIYWGSQRLICLLLSWKWKSLSRVWLFATPWTIVIGILQARILEWVALPSSRGSSQPRNQTQVSRIAGGFFTIWANRETQEYWSG